LFNKEGRRWEGEEISGEGERGVGLGLGFSGYGDIRSSS